MTPTIAQVNQIDSVTDLILGPTGGAMAFCFMVGVVVGWIGRQKVFEKYLDERDSQNQKRIEALQARNDSLWQRLSGSIQINPQNQSCQATHDFDGGEQNS